MPHASDLGIDSRAGFAARDDLRRVMLDNDDLEARPRVIGFALFKEHQVSIALDLAEEETVVSEFGIEKFHRNGVTVRAMVTTTDRSKLRPWNLETSERLWKAV